MSKAPNQTLINGQLCKITKNKSAGFEWSINNATFKTVSIIDELLKGSESEFKFTDGITVINPLTTIELAIKCDSTRPSNDIGIVRAETKPNTILTFYKSGNKPYYGVIKSKENIQQLQELKLKILDKLSK